MDKPAVSRLVYVPVMESSGNHGVRTMTKHLKVLLPSSFRKLRISEELARHFDAGDGGAGMALPTALVVSPFGKVWHVEVGRDCDGAFLGRGWPEFAGAHGIGVGWFLVLRHEGGGVLTVKAFDTSSCLREFCSLSTVTVTRSSRDGLRKPQFIRVLQPDFMERMLIPAKFVQRYITEAHLSSRMALVCSPLGKFWRMELKKDQSGVFFAGGWSQCLAFHGISEGDAVLFRYEGNMVFKIKVFGLNGCQKDFNAQGISVEQNIEKKQEAPHSTWKRKSKSEGPSGEENKRPKKSVSTYEIGPPSWIKKEISTSALQRLLSLSWTFCNAIGFCKPCTITLKTSLDSTRSWQVQGRAYKNGCYLLGEGWKSFCQENKLKEGDVCTFNVVKTTLWHVVITHG